VIVLEGDRDPITAGRTETLGRIHPGPAADDTVTAIDCSPLRAVRWRSIVSVVIAVLDPLRDTAVHIVEPKVIRCEFAYRRAKEGCVVLSAAVTAGVAGGLRPLPAAAWRSRWAFQSSPSRRCIQWALTMTTIIETPNATMAAPATVGKISATVMFLSPASQYPSALPPKQTLTPRKPMSALCQ